MILIPTGTKLITLEQLKLIQQEYRPCVIWHLQSENEWQWHVTSNPALVVLGKQSTFAINEQDYYHYFGCDKLLDPYFMEPYNVPIRLTYSSEELFMSYCSGRHKDRWSVRRYDNTPRGYSDLTYGTELHCREFLVKRLNDSLPKWYPVKVNFKFTNDLYEKGDSN